MFNRITYIVLFLALATVANAQYLPGKLQGGSGVPGTQSRSPLNSLERAANNLPGVTIITDTFGNQRLAYYVRVLDTCVNYNPLLAVGNLPVSSFVYQCGPNDSLFYIDWKSDAVLISTGGGAAACDEDWLQISDNSCPDTITDSIYHYRYAAIGARYVWPTAEFLVNDSTATAVQVLSGSRNARQVFYDNNGVKYSTIDQSGATTLWYLEPAGSQFRILTAGGGTPASPGAPFVNQFAVNPPDSTVQMYLYPDTRIDTQTVRNFLYTDPVGKIRSQPIDSLVQIVIDSIAGDTTVFSNWYNTNDTTTNLLRTAFVLRSAWWRGLDSVGLLRWSMRPDGFDGSQFTLWQDSVVVDADTVLWASSWHPELQVHELHADGTYFYADSTKVVGIGQFPAFPSISYDGAEKGFFYDFSNEGVLLINGDATNGSYSYYYLGQNQQQSLTYFDVTGNDQVTTTINTASDICIWDNIVVANESPFSDIVVHIESSDNNIGGNYFGVLLTEKDTNFYSSTYLGESNQLNNIYIGRRAWGARTTSNTVSPYYFDWIQSYLPNDTIENAVSFYNRAYYWRNKHPIGAAGDTLFHFWAATGPGGEAGQDPGFMTLNQICDHCAENVVNWYTSDGTTTDNSRVATVLETATWLSDDIASDGVVPFRWQLSAVGSQNEPEMMVWKFDSGDSLLLSQSDQEIIFFSNNYLVSKTDQAFTIQADSFQYNPNLGGVGFKVGANNVMTQNAITGASTHKDAVEYNTITGTAQTEIFLDGSSAVWVVPTNSNSNFKIHISAICSAAGNGVGISTGDAYNSWHLGGIKRVTNTTSIVGSVQADATAQADASFADAVVTIDADDTDESLRIRFTPPSTAGTTTVIRVVASIEITQTSY